MILISHRGYSSAFPENTMLAFREADRLKTGWIELDVTLTKDRKLVVIHDDTIDRTSDGSGAVRDITYQELLEYDFGSWKNPAFSGEKIPLLEEVMADFGQRLEINVELKSGLYEEPGHSFSLENQTLQVIEQFGMLDRVIVSSFDSRYLVRLAREEPKLRLAPLIWKQSLDEAQQILSKSRYYSLHIPKEAMSQAWVELAGKAGVKLLVYTVNDAETYEKALELGVHGVFTDCSDTELKDAAASG